MDHRQPASETVYSMGPLSDLVGVRLRRVDTLLTGAFATAMASLRSGGIASLGLIVGNPGISQNEIAKQTGTDKSIIVSIIDQLEELGWAVRTPSATDKRRHALYPTKLGQAELDRIGADINAKEQALLADVSPEDLQDLFAILDRMHASCQRVLKTLHSVTPPRHLE